MGCPTLHTSKRAKPNVRTANFRIHVGDWSASALREIVSRKTLLVSGTTLVGPQIVKTSRAFRP
jgi:hypothetical protein